MRALHRTTVNLAAIRSLFPSISSKEPDFTSGPLVLVVLAMLVAHPGGVVASPEVLQYELSPDRHILYLKIEANSSFYYILRKTENFQEFHPVSLQLGRDGPSWSFLPLIDETAAFFNFEIVSIFQPVDSDGDGIDDRYELEHPDNLDPLDPSDARKIDSLTGQSFYAEYLRSLFGSPNSPPQFIGREVTVFNFGRPTAPVEAISREITVFNALPNSGSPQSEFNQSISREVTVFNFGSRASPVEAISREATVFNFGSAPARTEAISRELTVYNSLPGSGLPAADFPSLVSREVTLFNFGQPSAAVEAISREITVLNFEEP